MLLKFLERINLIITKTILVGKLDGEIRILLSGNKRKRDCSTKEKIAEPKCVNCGGSGHLAAWKGCKAFPVIKKPSTRQPGRSYAQATAEKTEEAEQTSGSVLP
ncbi:hypothetical protein AVEN_40163-1 [Araneus ventricosus]|uniref:Uncharacterized protein n=1 Tax=Araneus ventricosus TaxID=182803 RepID=A0A4Y2PE39_ARAVE|nr:hypothetical protein AVEN_40163-1 [Araneus ventricosus]